LACLKKKGPKGKAPIKTQNSSYGMGGRAGAQDA